MYMEHPVYLKFLGLINHENAGKIVATIEAKLREGRRDFYLAMKSPGGEAFAGQWLYGRLRELPITLTTHNRKHVGSAAMDLYLAGERRLAEPGATFLIHQAQFSPEERARCAAEANAFPALLSIHNAFTTQLLLDRTQMTRGQIEAVIANENETTAEEAVEMGIEHETVEIRFPTDAELIELMFPWGE